MHFQSRIYIKPINKVNQYSKFKSKRHRPVSMQSSSLPLKIREDSPLLKDSKKKKRYQTREKYLLPEAEGEKKFQLLYLRSFLN